MELSEKSGLLLLLQARQGRRRVSEARVLQLVLAVAAVEEGGVPLGAREYVELVANTVRNGAVVATPIVDIAPSWRWLPYG